MSLIIQNVERYYWDYYRDIWFNFSLKCVAVSKSGFNRGTLESELTSALSTVRQNPGLERVFVVRIWFPTLGTWMRDSSVSCIQFDLSFGWGRLSLEHLSDTENTHRLYAISKILMYWTKKARSSAGFLRGKSSFHWPVTDEQLGGGFNYVQR